MVAATVGQHTGVWAVDHDPADPQPKDVVVRAPAASTDAKVISPKVGENIHESAYQRGIPSSEALQASKDVASGFQPTVEGCSFVVRTPDPGRRQDWHWGQKYALRFESRTTWIGVRQRRQGSPFRP